MRNSVQLKLLYSFMLIIVVMLVGVLLSLSALVKEQMLAHKQQELITKGYELSRVVDSFYQENSSFEKLNDFLGNVDSFIDSRVWVIDKSRQVVAMSGPRRGGRGIMGGPGGPGGPGGQGPMGRLMGGPAGQGGIHMLLNELEPVYAGNVWAKTFDHPFYGEKMLVVAVPVKLADGSVGGAVILNTPVTGINEFMQQIYLYVGLAGFIAIVLALLVAAKLTRSIVHPLQAMQETAAAMARGDYSVQVKVESGDEVGKLGLALNSLSHDLARNVAELEKLDRLRRDFVANVSHELRTPLTIIRGYNEALLDGTVDNPDQVKRYHRLMKDETVRLERLIRDLLDLSRLQTGNCEEDDEKIPLAMVADSVVNMMMQQAEQKQVALVANSQESLPNIVGNGDRITQLLVILIDNALKFTPPGGKVMVSTALEQDQVVLTVADTGRGIPAEDLPFIWERFYKVDKSHSRNDDGTGLGLAIAKQIIDMHHAQAEVTSRLYQGTTFKVKFPWVKAHNVDPSPRSSE